MTDTNMPDVIETADGPDYTPEAWERICAKGEEMKLEGAKLDPAKVKRLWHSAPIVDVYSVADGSLCVGKVAFYANPDGPWVYAGDIPDDIFAAIEERFRSEDSDGRCEGTKTKRNLATSDDDMPF